MGARHYGKAMVSMKNDQVTIIQECCTCGRVELGPIHPLHLRSIAQMINTMADALGVPEDNMNQVTEQVGATSEAEYEAAKQQFEQIPVAPIDDGQVPLWQRVKGLFGKETLH